MRIFFFLLFCTPFFALENLQINEHRLRKKINHPPAWMREQIKEDLEPFNQSGITPEMLETTIANIYALPGNGGRARLAKVVIENNTVSITKFGPFNDLFSGLDGLRVSAFKQFFSIMSRYFELPNCVFLLSLWDYYDNPVYLHVTTAPVFTISKRKTTQKAVLFPEVQAYLERAKIYQTIQKAVFPSWHYKIEKAFWRGRTTGGIYMYQDWDRKPRPQLCLFAQKHPDLLDAGFATVGFTLSSDLKKLLEHAKLFRKESYRTEWLKYKYLIAVDGNSFASSLWWELLSSSVTLKSTSEFIEWFYKGLEPYVHYVPFDPDCSDLEKQILWLKLHDNEAQKIASAATAFALDNLSIEDMMAYFYHLLHAYEELQRF